MQEHFGVNEYRVKAKLLAGRVARRWVGHGSAGARWGARPWLVSAWWAGAGGQSSEETSHGTL